MSYGRACLLVTVSEQFFNFYCVCDTKLDLKVRALPFRRSRFNSRDNECDKRINSQFVALYSFKAVREYDILSPTGECLCCVWRISQHRGTLVWEVARLPDLIIWKSPTCLEIPPTKSLLSWNLEFPSCLSVGVTPTWLSWSIPRYIDSIKRCRALLWCYQRFDSQKNLDCYTESYVCQGHSKLCRKNTHNLYFFFKFFRTQCLQKGRLWFSC